MAGIYIHVPFCKTRCIYCDFYTRTDSSLKREYIDALCKEIVLRRDYTGTEDIETIYFGGGTPSQLSYEDFSQVFKAIYDNFSVIENAEITLEANPDDLSETYLKALRKHPFNRLSMGVQSFNDDELRFLNRRHSVLKAKEAVKLCKSFGYDNISIDLMYGLPNQTMHTWLKNLDDAIELDIQHISSYHLIYEEGTRLYRLLNKGDIKPVNEDLSVDMFSVMIDKLSSSGFEHYEISNFAGKGLYSKHNSSYWLGKKYLGLGAAAHSFDAQNRAWNVASISKYIDGINKSTPAIEIEILDENASYNDFILTGMRTMWGVNLNELEKKFGKVKKDYALRNVRKHILHGLVSEDNGILKFTSKGIFLSDGIMSDMMWIED